MKFKEDIDYLNLKADTLNLKLCLDNPTQAWN